MAPNMHRRPGSVNARAVKPAIPLPHVKRQAAAAAAAAAAKEAKSPEETRVPANKENVAPQKSSQPKKTSGDSAPAATAPAPTTNGKKSHPRGMSRPKAPCALVTRTLSGFTQALCVLLANVVTM